MSEIRKKRLGESNKDKEEGIFLVKRNIRCRYCLMVGGYYPNEKLCRFCGKRLFSIEVIG